MDLILLLTVPPAVTSKGIQGDQCAQVHSLGVGTKFCPCDARVKRKQRRRRRWLCGIHPSIRNESKFESPRGCVCVEVDLE